ncbi:MAG: polysaccharide deacetylase family protein [Alphaproteobacteria bacterium]
MLSLRSLNVGKIVTEATSVALMTLALSGFSSATAQAMVGLQLPKVKPNELRNGDVLQTASPTSMPLYVSIKPGVKPKFRSSSKTGTKTSYGVENGLTDWVMPSRKYQATRQEVGVEGSMLCNVTFDDGPHPKYDAQILDILDRYNARATFYLVGRNVKRYPDTTRLIASRGHEIGHHSWKHDNLKKIGRNNMAKDLARTSATIRDTVGFAPTVFRPPYGNHTPSVLSVAKSLGMETQLWTVDSLDWKRAPAYQTTERVLSRTKPGAVILLHSIHRQTVEALPAIMDGLVKKGCKFVTSSEWISAVSG